MRLSDSSPGNHPAGTADVADDLAIEALSNVVDQDLDGVALDLLPPPVEPLLELGAGQDGPRPLRQRAQQPELAGRQDVPPVAVGTSCEARSRRISPASTTDVA